MPWINTGAAVVINAQRFNPSVFSQLWLVRHGLLTEEDFLPGCLFTDVLVQVRSRRFHLLVVPEKLQFVPDVSEVEQQSLLVEKVGAIVRTLPHTPFNGLGLNFNWQYVPIEQDVAAFTRDLFFRDDRRLYRKFDAVDAHFGGYFSKNEMGFRLKLDVKPIMVVSDERPENRVQFSFNFHSDLGVDPAQEIEQHILRWNDAKAESERIIDSVEQRD